MIYLNSFTEIKDGACIINLDEYSDIQTHWVALYVETNNNNNNNNKNNNNNNNYSVIYFDSFGVEYITKEIKAVINCPSSSALHNKNNNKSF